ncbi:MAG TPA: hypothetical protein VMF89_25810, partial [Polyangiales bacterium]|nr:hypothetical protein [Polyangiales bacterium]
MRETVRSLDIAARSIVETQALGGTVAGVIAERALDHHWQGLFQYVAVRIGTEAAAKSLEQLVRDVESDLRDKLDAPPGPQANLYRRLRELTTSTKTYVLGPDSSLWWAPDDA